MEDAAAFSRASPRAPEANTVKEDLTTTEGNHGRAPSTSSEGLSRSSSDKRKRKESSSMAVQRTEAHGMEYDLATSFEVTNELQTPTWVYDPVEGRTLWGNEAVVAFFGKTSMDEFLAHHMDADFAAKARRAAAGEDGASQAQWKLTALPPSSPHRDGAMVGAVLTIRFRVVSVRGAGDVLLVTANGGMFDSIQALRSLESLHREMHHAAPELDDSLVGARAAGHKPDHWLHDSLRAMEMLKTSPIFTFLFGTAGDLLTANPCAVAFYESYFAIRSQEGKQISLQNILSVADLGDEETVAYPDGNGPPAASGEGVGGSDATVTALMDHVRYVLFVQKFESFRIQLKMAKRRDPKKHRWVEFEMWAARDPVTDKGAILVNQTNLQETKRLELELKGKHDDLRAKNEILQSELDRANRDKSESLDLDSTVDKTINLLEGIIRGNQPTEEELRALKRALRTRNLRAPNRLEEMLLGNKAGFEGEVGLSLFEMLNPNTKSVPGQPLSARENSNMRRSLSRNSTMELDDDNDEKAEGEGEGEALEPAAAGPPRQPSAGAAVAEVLETVDEWFFDAFRLEECTNGHPLSVLSCHLFARLNLYETFQIDDAQFFQFCLKIEQGYPNNAYHNRVHVSNVLQSMYVLLTKGLGPRLAGDHEIAAGLLSAIIHDYEHKGVNNDFLIRFQDDLALKYNDRSPLENHHVAAAFEVMVTKPHDIFKQCDPEVFISIRKCVIEMVLATDMKIHFDVLGRFKQIEEKVREGVEDLMPEDVSLALQVCLKCADIGHCYCESNVHLRWVQKLEQEFFAQGDREEEFGAVAKSPLMDREKAGITKSQVGFFKIVVVPLFASFCKAFPSAEPMLSSLNRNLELWAKVEEEQLEISEVFEVAGADQTMR